jgi:hypothetical protein
MVAPNLGTGTSPFGTGAYGYGTAAVAPVPGGLINRDSRGRQQGSLALLQPTSPGGQSYAMTSQSPKIQYVFDEFGRRVGAPDVVHMVILALATVRGTSVDPNIGQRFAEIRKVKDSFQKDMQTRVEEALADLTSRKLIRIDSVTTEPGNGSPAATRVRLTDLSTQHPVDLAV